MQLTNILKLLFSNIILSSCLYALDTIQPADFTKYPLPKELTAQSRGGDLPDKIAATDGVGTIVLGSIGSDTAQLDNSTFNNLLYSNINKLDENETIIDKVTIDERTLNKLNDNYFVVKLTGFYCPTGLTLEGDRCYTDTLCLTGEPDGNGNCNIGEIEYKDNGINIYAVANVRFGIEKNTNRTFIWGNNYNYKLGIGSSDTDDHPNPILLSDKFSISKLVSSNYDMCALTTDNDIYCWGKNNYGQLGDGTTTDRYTPAKVNSDIKFSNIISFPESFCGIEKDTNDMYCWGNNEYGQLGNGTFDDTLIPTKVSTDKSFVNYSITYGINYYNLTYGYYFMFAEDINGDIYSWGNGTTQGIAALGNENKNTPTFLFNKNRFKYFYDKYFLSDGYTSKYYSTASHCDIENDTGNIYCWGSNYHGELGDGTNDIIYSPTKISDLNFHTLSSGRYVNCAIDENYDTYCWGYNEYGQIGDGNSNTDLYTPTKVTGGYKFYDIRVFTKSVCGIEKDTNDMYCWGNNEYGQLGDGTTTDKYTPTKVTGNIKFSSFYIDIKKNYGYNICGIEKDTNNVYCWGQNNYGQLGLGNADIVTEPTEATVFEKYNKVYFNNSYSICGIDSSNEVYCWGKNNYGQVGDGTTTDRYVPTKVNTDFKINTLYAIGEEWIGIDTNNKLVSWGHNIDGDFGTGEVGNVIVPKFVGSGSSSTPEGCTGKFTEDNGRCWEPAFSY